MLAPRYLHARTTVMVLQRDMLTRKLQHWSTTTGRFITDSIILLQLILVAQICIYLPSPLMIDTPPRIRDPDMPQICYQLPSLLTLKTLLVHLDYPLRIRHISSLPTILILSVFWRKMCLWKVDSAEDTVVGNITSTVNFLWILSTVITSLSRVHNI